MGAIGLTNETLYTACCIWTRPDRPKGRALKGWRPHLPILTHLVQELPRVGDSLSLELPRHDDTRVGELERPVVVVHGVVRRVEYREALDTYMVFLKRRGRVGARWAELEGQLGKSMTGYHPDVGRVEGVLEYLLPAAELAVLYVPTLREVYRARLRDLGTTSVLEQETDEGPRVPVAWSAVWSMESPME